MSIRLAGYNYYQQYRKCGKPNCRTCSSSKGHGPYWYARNIRDGSVKYVGRRLPLYLKYCLEGWPVARKLMLRQARDLREQADILSRFAFGEKLFPNELEIIEPFGFNGNHLVLPARSAETQDR